MVDPDRERDWQIIEENGGISTPAEGVALNAEHYGYKARKSSLNQAATWNRILAGHPVYDPGVCGFVVGAGSTRVDGYFPLVWERAAGTGKGSDAGPPPANIGAPIGAPSPTCAPRTDRPKSVSP